MSNTTIAQVKQLILMPGLIILIPSIITTGITGKILSKGHKGRIIKRKIRRMRLTAVNGILILVPSAFYLSIKAGAGELAINFYTIQIIEITAGALNFILMIKNVKDGKLLRGSYNA